MCATCGCAADGAVLRVAGEIGGARDGDDHGGHGHGGDDHHGHDHHGHDHGGDDHGGHGGHGGHGHGDGQAPPGQLIAPPDARTITLQRKILAKNDDLAAANREWLAGRGVFMLNLMSAPGAGKTTLLERTARDLAGRMRIAVIEGDQQTALDARRIEAAGCQVVQINTGAGCHLDAQMVASALRALDPAPGTAMIVENVGNLVCPALFDLGEAARVVLASVTEGADKPMKYPQMFRQSDLIVVTKIDLLPYVDFDTERYAADIARISPAARLIELSAVSSAGVAGWYDWLAAESARFAPR